MKKIKYRIKYGKKYNSYHKIQKRFLWIFWITIETFKNSKDIYKSKLFNSIVW